MAEREDDLRREEANTQEARDTGSIINFMAARKVGTAMWVLRAYLMFLSIQYLFFCSAFDMNHFFTRAMLANGIICALRLHQRIPEFKLTRHHLALVMSEDSGHYLMFSLIFLFGQPITIALMPVTVFALLHTCSFSRQMIDIRGSNSYPPLRKIINHVAKHQATLFRFIAMNEILIMPISVVMAFGGKTLIMTPFLYYRFLTYRYLSRRNPYSRLTFYELHLSIKYMTESPNCPSLVRSLLYKAIAFTMKLAPTAAAFQAQPQDANAQT